MFKFTRILERGKGRIWGFSTALFSSPVLSHSAAGDCVLNQKGSTLIGLKGQGKGAGQARGEGEGIGRTVGPRHNRF